DGFVDFEKPQQFSPDGKGGFTLTMVMGSEADKSAKKLLGVVTTENSWIAGESLRGLQVAADFAPTPPAVVGRTDGRPGASPSAVGGSFLVTLAVAFVGGLILNLMPCVFPVIGIKILGFVNQAGHERAKVVAHGLIFTVGVLLSFWVLAGVLALLGGGRGW